MSKHRNKSVAAPSPGKPKHKEAAPISHSAKAVSAKKPEPMAAKMAWWVALVPAAIVFCFAWLTLSLYPHTESMLEKVGFYIGTGDFIAGKMSEYPGVNNLLSSWLVQFFQSPTAGAVIESAMLALVAMLASLVPVAWFKGVGCRLKSCTGPSVLLAAIPALGLLLLFTHKLSLYISALWFFGALCLVGLAVRRKSNVLYFAAVVAVGLLSFLMISFPVTVLLMAVLAALVLAGDKSGGADSRGKRVVACLRIAVPLLLIVVVALLVAWSSASLDFIPLDSRWWYAAGAGERLLALLCLFVAPVALMFVPRVKKAWRQVAVEVACCALIGLMGYRHMAADEESKTTETVYRYLDYAENGEWAALLDEVRSEADNTNMFYIQCAMLAEARLGTLADNLFNYPINTPEQFCPRLDTKPYATDFNRIFYREIGVYDEAFHQTFEYGMRVTPESGFCFASLRHMTEYAVKLGDRKLAEKYLSLLEKTSCHADFVAEQRSLLKDARPAKAPLRSFDFVRAFVFNSEMAHLLDHDKDNKMVSDYLLCGLLLSKNLEIFKTILIDRADNYKGAMLPRAYAEAAAMINHLRPGIFGDAVKYSPDYDRQFEQFMTVHNSGQDDSAFKGTFWYYYVYAEIPSLAEWQNAGHSTS